MNQNAGSSPDAEQRYKRMLNRARHVDRREREADGGGLTAEARAEKSGFGMVKGIGDTPYISPFAPGATDAERYQEQQPERFAGQQSERFQSPVESDQERSRKLRASQIATLQSGGDVAIDQTTRGGVARARQVASKVRAVVAQAEQIASLVKKAKNLKAVLTLVGAAAALTPGGIIWTIIQWNTQMVWAWFGLPGKDYIGLPTYLVPVILAIDLLFFVAFAFLIFWAAAIVHPVDAFCSLFKLSFGDTWYSGLVEKGCIAVGS